MSLRFNFFLLIIAVGSIVASAQDKPVPQPTLVSAPTPVYPQEAKDAFIGGKVTVRVVVDEQGKVVSVDDAQGPARLCNSGNGDHRLVAMRQAMIDAMKQAKFQPAMKDGKPVKSTTYVSSTFNAIDDSKIATVGMVVRYAIKMAIPRLPEAAKVAAAVGPVAVHIVIDEKGNPFTAEAITGHPSLRSAAVDAACNAKFTPLKKDDAPVMMSGMITYNFSPLR